MGVEFRVGWAAGVDYAVSRIEFGAVAVFDAEEEPGGLAGG